MQDTGMRQAVSALAGENIYHTWVFVQLKHRLSPHRKSKRWKSWWMHFGGFQSSAWVKTGYFVRNSWLLQEVHRAALAKKRCLAAAKTGGYFLWRLGSRRINPLVEVHLASAPCPHLPRGHACLTGEGNGLKLHQGMFRLDIGKNSSLEVLSGIIRGCPGQWWSNHPWRCRKEV